MSDASRIDELDLLAYADGLLDHDPERRAAVEAAVAADPEAMARAEAFRAQTGALREAYDRRLAEPVPERLVAVLDRPAGGRPGPALRAAAVACLVVGAGAAGWLLGQDDAERGAPGAELIERSYAQFVAEHPAEMAPAMGKAVAEAKPLGWLAEEVSIRLKAPDLSGAGYELVEKRAVTVDGEQIVRLDYAGPGTGSAAGSGAGSGGRGFSLFLAPRWEARPNGIAQAERGDVSLAYWLDGPLASTVVARMPATETRALAEAVRHAMHADGNAPAVLDPDPAGRTAQGLDAVADTTTPTADGMPPQILKTRDDGETQNN